jgi:hypothetical protein
LTTSEPDREATAVLAMARRLCSGLTEREQLILLFRKRYEGSQNDPRMTPEKRVEIAGEFVRAVHKADHVYEDRVGEALEEYRQLMSSELSRSTMDGHGW